MERYMDLLRGKRVAVFANQTARVGATLLVDTLLKRGIQVVRDLCALFWLPRQRHECRGGSGGGGEIRLNGAGGRSSLYGNHLEATAADLKGIHDVLVSTTSRDVGVRWYTYISSLQYYLEAAMENGKPLVLLDRPNPNGGYVDGPVLDTCLPVLYRDAARPCCLRHDPR